MKVIRGCSFKPKRRTVGNAELMKVLHPLLIRYRDGTEIDCGFMIRPPEMQPKYLFLDCLFGRQKKQVRPSGRVLSSQPKPAS